MKRPYRLRWHGYASADDVEARIHTANFATDAARRDKHAELSRYGLIVGMVSLFDHPMTQGNATDAGPWPVDHEVTETCPVHSLMHTLGTGCPECETDFAEGPARLRGEL